MKVLFVCRGNVGRSQMAEAIFKLESNNNHSVESAGIEAMGSDGKDLNGMLLKDRASSKYVIEVMNEIGVDISNNRIKRLTPEMVASADKIIAMLSPEILEKFFKDNKKVINWDVLDPDEQTLEFHRKTRDEIMNLVKGFIENNY